MYLNFGNQLVFNKKKSNFNYGCFFSDTCKTNSTLALTPSLNSKAFKSWKVIAPT